MAGRKTKRIAARDSSMAEQIAASIKLANANLEAMSMQEISPYVWAFFGRKNGLQESLAPGEIMIMVGPPGALAALRIRRGATFVDPDLPKTEQDARSALSRLQLTFRRLLAVTATRRTAPAADGSAREPTLQSDQGELSLRYRLIALNAVPVLFIEGPAYDVGVFHMLRLLGDPESARLRACPECGAIFFRRWRREQCSKRCTDRAAARNRKPVTSEQRRQNADRAHERYRTRKRKEAGRPVKITRRPRLKAQPPRATL